MRPAAALTPIHDLSIYSILRGSPISRSLLLRGARSLAHSLSLSPSTSLYSHARLPHVSPICARYKRAPLSCSLSPSLALPSPTPSLARRADPPLQRSYYITCALCLSSLSIPFAIQVYFIQDILNKVNLESKKVMDFSSKCASLGAVWTYSESFQRVGAMRIFVQNRLNYNILQFQPFSLGTNFLSFRAGSFIYD